MKWKPIQIEIQRFLKILQSNIPPLPQGQRPPLQQSLRGRFRPSQTIPHGIK